MKLSFDFKKINIVKKLIDNLGLTLVFFLGLVFVAVAWVVFGEVAQITQIQTDLSSAQSKIVRVNMDKYKQVENLLIENAEFSPKTITGTDAFEPLDPPEEED